MSHITADQRRRALRALKRVMQEESAVGYFNDPVDCEALGIPEYREIVKRPMDLTKVYSKLDSGEYMTLDQVLDDVSLVWSNCYLFNEPGSDVCIACDAMANLFSQVWKQCGLEKWVAAIDVKAYQAAARAGPSMEIASKGKRQPLPGGVRQDSQGGAPRGPAKSEKALRRWEEPSLRPDGVCQLTKRPKTAGKGEKGAGRGDLRPGPPLERCLKVIETLLRQPQAAVFNWALPGEPSLRSVKARLVPGLNQGYKYQHVTEVLRDVRNVFDNCRCSVHPNDTILQQCEDLDAMFRSLWRQAGLPTERAEISREPVAQRDIPLGQRRIPTPPAGLHNLETEALHSLADFGSHDVALDGLAGASTSHQVPRHAFPLGQQFDASADNLSQLHPHPAAQISGLHQHPAPRKSLFDPMPIIRAAQIQPWERALLKEYARLRHTRQEAHRAVQLAEEAAQRLSTVKGELQAARAAAAQLPPLEKPPPEPWPPNARYTNSSTHGPASPKRVPAALWDAAVELFAKLPHSQTKPSRRIEPAQLPSQSSSMSAWERRLASGPSLHQLRQLVAQMEGTGTVNNMLL